MNDGSSAFAGFFVITILWMLSNILFGIFSAIFAGMKRRSIVGWFLIGCLFSFFGLLVIAFPQLERRPWCPEKPKPVATPVIPAIPAPHWIEIDPAAPIDPQQAHARVRFSVGNWDEQTHAEDSVRHSPDFGDGLI